MFCPSAVRRIEITAQLIDHFRLEGILGATQAYSTDRYNKMETKTDRPARGRPKTLDRDHLLQIAMTAYWADGPTAVSVNEICRRAGVSKPGLYREFSSEDGLKRAALEAYQTTILAPLKDILTSDQPFDQALESLIKFVLLDHKAHGLPDGCLHVSMCHNRDELGPLTQNGVDAFRKQTLTGFENWIDRAKSNRQFKPEISTPAAALYIDAQIASVMGLQKQGVANDMMEDVLRLAFSVFV